MSVLSVLGLTAYAPFVALALILLLIVAFASERLPPEVVAISGMAASLILGLVDTKGMLSGLSNSAPWTIIAMFMLSAALVRTGVLGLVTERLRAMSRYGTQATIALFIAFVVVISAFMNNTPLVVMMIPLTFSLAATSGISTSRLLMPLSFAAILGGTCSLIGTSTNILVDGVARSQGLAPFGLFEITSVGILVAIVGIVYLAVAGRYFMPERSTVTDALGNRTKTQFLVEVLIPHDSPMIGRSPRDIGMFDGSDRRVVDVIRGDASLRRDMGNVILAAGDIVVLKSPVANVLTIRDRKGVEVGAGAVPAGGRSEPDEVETVAARSSIVVEALIGPGSRFIGRTLRDERLRRRYGVYPIALHRAGTNLENRLEDVRLQVGDTLLIEGSAEDLGNLARDAGLVNLNATTERATRDHRAPIAVLTLLAVVVGSAFGVMPIVGLAWIGVAFVLLMGCIDADEAFEAVDWRIIVMIYSMLTIGKGLEDAGTVELLVHWVVPKIADMPVVVILSVIYLLASALTEIVTNNAVAVVVTPVAIGVAQGLGMDPRPFVVAVMFAASASFATPIGYQTNTLVYSAGGYRFMDFVRIGLPLNILAGIATVFGLWLFWL